MKSYLQSSWEFLYTRSQKCLKNSPKNEPDFQYTKGQKGIFANKAYSVLIYVDKGTMRMSNEIAFLIRSDVSGTRQLGAVKMNLGAME